MTNTDETIGDDESFVDAYLRRLKIERQLLSDSAFLKALHAAHVRTIPFENLSVHLGEQVSLEPAALAFKVLAQGRGGVCYELNGLFAQLLERLGYHVELLGARVWNGLALGPPLDHLLAVVTSAGEERAIVDVGFGDHSLYPLPWQEGIDHTEPGGVFRLEAGPDGTWDLFRNGSLQYRIEPNHRVLTDFAAMNWYHHTSPDSHFTTSLVCTRRTESGRVTLSGRNLIVTTSDGREETELTSDEAVLDAYRSNFGIDLEIMPRLPPASDAHAT